MYLWSVKKIKLKLKHRWSINGGAVSEKENYIIQIEKNNTFGLGEVAASTKNNDLPLIEKTLQQLNFKSIQTHQDIIGLNVCPQVKQALEVAFIQLKLNLEKSSWAKHFNIKETLSVPTNYSIPILPIDNVSNYIAKNNIQQYSSCKVKINGNNSLDFLNEIHKHYKGPLRIDANECFANSDDCLNFIKQASHLNIQFLEQPLKRNHSLDDCIILKNKSPWLIIGDESIQDEDVNKEHCKQFDGLNLKLMKSGGPTQLRKQIDQCKKMNLKIMIGCMVESSLNISVTLQLGSSANWFDLDGCLLLSNEPYNLVEVQDGIIKIK